MIRLIVPFFAACCLAFSLRGAAASAKSAAKEVPPPSAGRALAQAKGPAQPQKPAPPVPEAPADDPRYQLGAITVVPERTNVLIGDVDEQTTRWLVAGDKFGDLELVSIDPVNSTVVARISGKTKTLHLKKSSIALGDGSGAANVATAPTPLSSGPAETAGDAPQPEVPATIEEQQAREARMFVSDLLEIGMQQRRAYEQKQADDAAKANPPDAAQ